MPKASPTWPPTLAPPGHFVCKGRDCLINHPFLVLQELTARSLMEQVFTIVLPAPRVNIAPSVVRSTSPVRPTTTVPPGLPTELFAREGAIALPTPHSPSHAPAPITVPWVFPNPSPAIVVATALPALSTPFLARWGMREHML